MGKTVEKKDLFVRKKIEKRRSVREMKKKDEFKFYRRKIELSNRRENHKTSNNLTAR